MRWAWCLPSETEQRSVCFFTTEKPWVSKMQSGRPQSLTKPFTRENTKIKDAVVTIPAEGCLGTLPFKPHLPCLEHWPSSCLSGVSVTTVPALNKDVTLNQRISHALSCPEKISRGWRLLKQFEAWQSDLVKLQPRNGHYVTCFQFTYLKSF